MNSAPSQPRSPFVPNSQRRPPNTNNTNIPTYFPSPPPTVPSPKPTTTKDTNVYQVNSTNIIAPNTILLPTQINNQTVSSLIDTGSMISVIDASLAKTLKLTWSTASSKKLQVADGSLTNILGTTDSILKFPTLTPSKGFSVTFHVISKLSAGILIGMDTLTTHGFIIDF